MSEQLEERPVNRRRFTRRRSDVSALEVVESIADGILCLEREWLSIAQHSTPLSLNEPVAIEFTPQQSGELPFVCGMHMLRGSVVVR